MLCNWETNDGYNEDVMGLFQDAGVTPKKYVYAFNTDSLFLQAQLTGAVVISSPLSIDLMYDTRSIPVEGRTTGPIAFWNESADMDKVQEFVDTAVDYFTNDYILD
jgi:hypothetical protein